jgi:hypothetical protein
MRKLMITLLTALATVPIVGLSAITATAPVFADTPGVSPTCFPQSANPHPTDPVGTTTNTLFCTSTNPNGSGTGGGSNGSGTAGSGAGGNGSTGTKTGGSQTSLASSTGSGTAGSTPDESTRFNWASDSNGATSGSAKPANGTGLFGSLVSFFSTVGGIVTLFGLLLLLLLILAGVAVMGWLRPGQGQNASSRFSRLTFRA